MRDLPEKLNDADFAQKLFNTAEANFTDLVEFAGISTRADLEDNIGVAETMLNASPLVGQVVQIQVEQALNGVQPAMIVDYGEAVEGAIGNVVCTGILSGFFIGHDEMGIADNQFYSSEVVDDEDFREAEGPLDTAVLVKPWLGIRLELLGYVLPEDTVAPVIEVPVQLIDGIRMAPIDHPLLPDYLVYYHDVMQPAKAQVNLDSLEVADDQEEVNDLILARRVLFSQAIGRKMVVAWTTDEKVIHFVDDNGRQSVRLSEVELFHGTLVGFDIEPIEGGSGVSTLHAIFQNAKGEHEYIEVDVERIVAGSLAAEDAPEKDHVLFGKLQDIFDELMDSFLVTQPTLEEACDFAASVCEELFNKLYELNRKILELRIDQDSSYSIIRQDVEDGVLDMEADRNEEGYAQLWVGEWYQMRCKLVGFNYSLDADVDEKAFRNNDFTLDLIVEPDDDLARHYDANFLRIAANDVLGARFAKLPRGYYN